MRPANVDPVECARLIVYAHLSATRETPDDARSAITDAAGQPDFPPSIALTLVCVVSSIAIVAWSIATQ